MYLEDARWIAMFEVSLMCLKAAVCMYGHMYSR